MTASHVEIRTAETILSFFFAFILRDRKLSVLFWNFVQWELGHGGQFWEGAERITAELLEGTSWPMSLASSVAPVGDSAHLQLQGFREPLIGHLDFPVPHS